MYIFSVCIIFNICLLGPVVDYIFSSVFSGEVEVKDIKQWVVSFINDEEAASAIEYALIAAMVAIALVAFVTPIRTAVSAIFTQIQTALSAGTGTGT